MSWVNQVIPLPRVRGLAQRWSLAKDLRRQEFDLAIIFPRSFDAALVPALARISRRIGVAADARTWLLTDAARLVTHDPEEHQSKGYLRLLESTLGVEVSDVDLGIAVAPHHSRAMQAWLVDRRRRPAGPLIALAPTAAYGPAKEWPVAHYAELIDVLATDFGAECVLVGSPTERPRCEAVAAASRCGALIAAGSTSIGQALGLLSLCDGFAGNDSGSMHMAGGCGIPTVGIFGSTNPTRTGPLGPRTAVLYERLACSPCLARTCRFGHYDCLKQISAPSVLRALDGLGAFARNMKNRRDGRRERGDGGATRS
ncbi:MAG: lipopolysaccharide heptosyltransferase II [Deltaproteobacteria bacterium]|nr:lipopolysaccharide heptosyltransferase II [Deltaproteobacteria bacterium]